MLEMVYLGFILSYLLFAILSLASIIVKAEFTLYMAPTVLGSTPLPTLDKAIDIGLMP